MFALSCGFPLLLFAFLLFSSWAAVLQRAEGRINKHDVTMLPQTTPLRKQTWRSHGRPVVEADAIARVPQKRGRLVFRCTRTLYPNLIMSGSRVPADHDQVPATALDRLHLDLSTRLQSSQDSSRTSTSAH
ncbi:hypothetical protein SNOG_13463 [Parastagonospora nodorum SN15]|uniref:Secreted protein n=1 Tax=Phaeosphaeria nodorum (strain SN15 / ATCC MYA-4574 / FGSC 10173) TaxID=321614 RepID=Q0U451_PHANO|nr:hypothetical protein SNOG_13463 [Parastagonospora nodorum SN15]EAT79347.1 hypothetical protein SNOG_13463 [Parastagonospora nodorum SN15]